MKKYSSTFLIVSIVLLTAAFMPAGKGNVYSTKEGKFSVTFPAAFKTEITEQESAKTIKTSAAVGDQTYFASYTLHEVEMTDPESLAETSLEAFTEATGGTLSDKNAWKIKAHNGLKAIITLEEQDAKIQYHVILVGQLQYQIIVVGPEASWEQKPADGFFKSFKLMK